ncbi:class I SAM-dependent methyltransferase [Teredinibacter sp. KSP-S5-2]|uniref:SAM-dependent methyltransferase n=1 Tax=Teredinibacter sp. KSP-S5-2 TaxID=3034506 RepID=UPI00293442F9|nr:class I SAM-dependent methyltransferase [Teredinibacter sp. KSP-S5-2]WNO10687.1 class I SAM-dependent methyltransferase [Teredinibacter sp. KSP-S5-2]
MWDEKYNSQEYIYGTEPNIFLKNNYAKIPSGKVLCLAEGEGRNAVFLAKQGYSVTAVDSSRVGLEKAERLAKENGVTIELIHEDLGRYDIGINQWDGIVSIFCHLPESVRKQIHSNILSALKCDGVFLLEAYTPEQLKYGTGGPPVKELMLSKQIISNELKGLIFSHLIELEREVMEGSHHNGVGAVVQAIGRKSEKS